MIAYKATERDHALSIGGQDQFLVDQLCDMYADWSCATISLYVAISGDRACMDGGTCVLGAKVSIFLVARDVPAHQSCCPAHERPPATHSLGVDVTGGAALGARSMIGPARGMLHLCGKRLSGCVNCHAASPLCSRSARGPAKKHKSKIARSTAVYHETRNAHERRFRMVILIRIRSCLDHIVFRRTGWIGAFFL